jgi:hypothetical protein
VVVTGWALTPHGEHMCILGACSLYAYTAGHKRDTSPQHRWAVYRDGECMASGRADDEADARYKAVTFAAMYGGEL